MSELFTFFLFQNKIYLFLIFLISPEFILTYLFCFFFDYSFSFFFCDGYEMTIEPMLSKEGCAKNPSFLLPPPVPLVPVSVKFYQQCASGGILARKHKIARCCIYDVSWMFILKGKTRKVMYMGEYLSGSS
jgi:hypothetical protein